MLTLTPELLNASLDILCIGAHADDIEIGCGGTILKWLDATPEIRVHWMVFSADGEREKEARRSAALFLQGAKQTKVTTKAFRDGFFPYDGRQIKDSMEELAQAVSPDVVFTHYRDDRHQDHRVISDLTWNTFREHLILEYEIPKYDGDLGSPNCFSDLDEELCTRKVQHLGSAFTSQAGKHWFSNDTFLSLMRLRGIESRARGGYAEAFYARKVKLGVPQSRKGRARP